MDTVRDTMRSWTHYSQDYQLYAYCLPVAWNYAQDRPYKGDTIKAKRRMYLHLFYSPDRALEDEKAFNSRLAELQAELESGRRHPDHEKQYAKYFDRTGFVLCAEEIKRGEEVIRRQDRELCQLIFVMISYSFFSFLFLYQFESPYISSAHSSQTP